MAKKAAKPPVKKAGTIVLAPAKIIREVDLTCQIRRRCSELFQLLGIDPYKVQSLEIAPDIDDRGRLSFGIGWVND